ncbi:helix-turn-helix transcriptional regulator [Tepidicaulis sp. LMO-SS28]|uniref:helix-turn-helix transcriptional regulator n=1 Tax=Tepidicaulis sp. LMO-SS28 TaxID=3447455 RepID=UPI003EE1F945
MRHEKAAILLRIALDMQGSALGLSLEDIQRNYAERPMSRRTAERLRDALLSVFPQMEEANPGEMPKRWRLKGAPLGSVTGVTAEELASLSSAVSLLKRENMDAQATLAEQALAKLRAQMKRSDISRIDPDLEALTQSEAIALRPGPRLKIDASILDVLRRAVITQRKVQLTYRNSHTNATSTPLVHPYGFLYGQRHYLIALSEKGRTSKVRNFALTNIDHAEVTEAGFERQPGFTLQSYANRSFGVYDEEPFDVIWKFTPDAAPRARDWLFHPTQTLKEQDDGSLIVRFHAGGLMEMALHVISWRGDLEVLKPAKLNSMVREILEQIR